MEKETRFPPTDALGYSEMQEVQSPSDEEWGHPKSHPECEDVVLERDGQNKLMLRYKVDLSRALLESPRALPESPPTESSCCERSN